MSDCQSIGARGSDDVHHLGTNEGVKVKRRVKKEEDLSTVSLSICKLSGQDSDALKEGGVQGAGILSN